MIPARECYTRLTMLLMALSSDRLSEKDLKNNPMLDGFLASLYLMKPDVEPRDTLKELWQTNYEQCKEHFVPSSQKPFQ